MRHFRTVLSTAVAAALGSALAQAAISDDVIKIGVLTDMSGTYSDLAGPGVVAAAEMAIADAGGKVAGKPIVMLKADHQNKADIAANKAREWNDVEKVDAYVDLVTTSTALAVMEIAKNANKVVLVSGAGSSRITNEDCNPVTVHWTYDTYAMAKGTGSAMVKEGGKTWFFLTADYAFGQNLQKDVSAVVEASGGKVLGAVKHPFPASDFSSFILQAQASGAQVIGLANAGADTTNAIKAANEFGIVAGGQKLAGLLVFISDVHSLGLPVAQGLTLTTGFYWDYDDQTRAWSKRFFEKTGKMPTMVQAGVYSSLMHYFKAIEATGSDDGPTVIKQMKSGPVEDFFSRHGKIRDDGRLVHDMFLAEVKKPSESKAPWDYYKILRVIPGDEAYLPLSESKCPLVRKS
ncbi:ABC transporter substrate-binding protein [Plasticicumulans sp.]|uniref:ABC transporter substrate-binding protein n=1 Tax=Plasticicumulans sp. TaxID=2307179 RepID=UPI002C10F6A3|nr:ABC transporter substrate-binding protein [Plasticicumulans sp.]HMW28843.1 ABC transporter substrate-binding protein [Plasticicumulans sp.]HMW41800.1 ABC transporter substrate-binding protein [Plasticicumulans sp.]HMZ09940.1 ABC transporter substrate-binding protein [Plasticicumulans sp.]HND98994.1 ABC transporter substrate-binding protein [Plasticicumulans sp.]HNG49328.1 ABC transporter substrate-binding protein [Plasticicumulans sp.]